MVEVLDCHSVFTARGYCRKNLLLCNCVIFSNGILLVVLILTNIIREKSICVAVQIHAGRILAHVHGRTIDSVRSVQTWYVRTQTAMRGNFTENRVHTTICFDTLIFTTFTCCQLFYLPHFCVT